MPYVRVGQRKVLKRKRSLSAPAVLFSTTAPTTKRKQWTETQMIKAIEAVKSRKSGVNHAA